MNNRRTQDSLTVAYRIELSKGDERLGLELQRDLQLAPF